MIIIDSIAKAASLTSGRKQSFGEDEEMPRLWTPTLDIFQPSDHRHVERVHHLPQEKGTLPPKLRCGGPVLSPQRPPTLFADSY
jgi:hypothetical protein